MSATEFHGWPTRPPVGRIAYVNGHYFAHGEAGVHIEDRGLQFSDGIYEVFGIIGGQPLDEEEHLDRLERSVREIGIAMPMSRAALKLVTRELVRRNHLRDALVYLQITRGAVRRDHPAPKRPPRPTFIMTAKPISIEANDKRRELGVSTIVLPDERWARRDIKSTALLPNILAKTKARDAGAFEAILTDADGYITEGASTTFWIVDKDGVLITRDLSHAVLPGVTRRVILDAAREAQVPVAERRITPEEAKSAQEAFLSAATLGATAVVKIDGVPVGDGRPGPLTRRIQELYVALAARRARQQQ